jgi:glycosyltransferase involved in cell wall biosynthesis
LRRTSDVHEYDLYTVDMGRADVFAAARRPDVDGGLSGHVRQTFRYPLLAGIAATVPLGKALPLEAVRRIRLVERRIAADIDARGYDAVFVHPCQLTHTPSLLRWLATPSIHYMHEVRRETFETGYRPRPRLSGAGSVPRWAATSAMERVLRRRDVLAAAAAGRLVCNSYYTAETIQRAYGRTADVCRPGVDGDVFSLGSGDRPLAAMSVGALDPVKGHHLVVEAVAELAADERPVVHLVYERCDDAYRREVEAVAAARGVDLRLHRGIADTDLARLYRSAAVTVVAARLEPFGLVPLESLASGTPVVAVREAGYRETVQHGVNGYLVDRDPTHLAEAVRRVLRGELGASPEDLRSTVIPAFDWDTFVKRQCELLAAASRP